MSSKLKCIADISQIIQEMSLDEKLTIINGGSVFRSASLEKYGIPSAVLMDGATGFNSMQMGMELAVQASRSVFGTPEPGAWTKQRLEQDALAPRFYFYQGEKNSFTGDDRKIYDQFLTYTKDNEMDYDRISCYPPGILLGATWNTEIVYQCGNALGREVSALGYDVLLGPNVNLHRDPRNGRLFEGYSEDPCLISGLAPRFVEGVQASGVLADVKHFAANNQETWRMGVDEQISERALRELYLPGFEHCIKDGNCRTVMSAYNKINGTACSENHFLLQKILREEWGFDGAVLSDWGAVYDWPEAIRAGNDLLMAGPVDISGVKACVLDGSLDLADVDRCVEHVLKMLLETPAMKGRIYTEIDTEYAMNAAYQAASEGITLLKNNHVLPLSKDKSTAFWGMHSKHLICCGEGSAEVVTNRNTNPFECSVQKVGEDRVLFETVTLDCQAIVVVVSEVGKEGRDRLDLLLSNEQKRTLTEAIAAGKQMGKPVIAVLNVCGPVELMEFEKDLDAIFCIYLPGMAGGQALADILYGDTNPSGKLPLTYPKYYRDCPTYGNFPGEYGRVMYGEGLYVGYRYYDKKGIKPMYPFGYGLSYTTFSVDALYVPDEVELEKNEGVPVTVRIKNTGAVPGREVIQIYVEDVFCHIDRPIRELKAFCKVQLEPGEEKEVTLALDRTSFSYYDTKLGRWVTEPGTFIVHVGTDSQTMILSQNIKIRCRCPYEVGPSSPIEELMSRPEVLEMLTECIPEMDADRDLKQVVIFDPERKFFQFWGDVIVPLLPEKTIQGREERYRKVCDGFERINRQV